MMFHDLDKIPERDLVMLYRMEQGNIIGQLAKKLYPKGIDLPESRKDFKLNIQKTKELLKERKILFEAGIIAGDLYARADILVPLGKDKWDIIEVKGSTRVKDDHFDDVSFQKYVYEKAGLRINKCFLMHINKEFIKKGDIEPKELLKTDDITKEVKEAIIGIQERIDEMMAVIKKREAPTIATGAYCESVKDCPSGDCWSFLPEEHVFELYRSGKKSFELLEAEVLCIKDIPDEYKLTAKQEIQKKCASTGKIHLNKPSIKKFLDKLTYPIHYLDFETFSTAVPLYEATIPYQQIPFQFSLHSDDGKKIKHFEFLHDNKEDPREHFLKELKKVLGDKGSIIIFYQSFEINKLKQLAEAFPEYKEWIDSVIKRIVDLLLPFRSFDYYNPRQRGSCSLKAVLPAITGKDYKHLDIAGGEMASVCYFESVFGDLKKAEIKKVREDLLKYCCLDTEAMVWIVDELRKLVK